MIFLSQRAENDSKFADTRAANASAAVAAPEELCPDATLDALVRLALKKAAR